MQRIVYLGGLGETGSNLSDHLRSRHEVGTVLAAGPVETVELRAAVVIGSGSASFEMLRYLTELAEFDQNCQFDAKRNNSVSSSTTAAGSWRSNAPAASARCGAKRDGPVTKAVTSSRWVSQASASSAAAAHRVHG